MISVLICSANEQLLNQAKKNIYDTIGSTTEILFYNNKENKKGICEVYNILAEKAKYPFLCFVHEDVLFTTKEWGKKLISIFNDKPEFGVVGIAGSKYKSAACSGWFTGIKDLDCANYTHRYTHVDERVYLNPTNSRLEEVVCLDGVFICCRKTIWQQVKFDEKNLQGFHFYDISFTLEAARICSLAVTYEIDLLHITKGGDFGNNWINTAIHYHSLVRDKLPFTKLPSISVDTERKIIITWLDLLKVYRISITNKVRWIYEQQLYKQTLLFYPVLKFLLYTPLHFKYLHILFKRK